MTTELVVAFNKLSKGSLALVGGKGANLGEMTQAGFPVPPGFCITTEAFRQFASSPTLAALYDELERVRADDNAAVQSIGARLREYLLTLPIPAAVEQAVGAAHAALGEQHPYAVRSSATAEDLPGASFAGQQDTYLNVVGRASLLEHVRRCWASLFTDRAIAYRAKNGFDHRRVYLSVVVQRQVLPETAGIMFSADPVDGRRHIVSIDAGFGLGEALVSGLVNADLYKVDKRSRAIVEKKVADKRLAIMPLAGGGTERIELVEPQCHAQVLSDQQIVELAELGARVERHYGSPQDMEWCIERGVLYLVQSRPITTLYPVPRGAADPGLRLFVSFGHAQVMTDVIAPFGREVWRMLLPFLRNRRGLSEAVLEAGSRLYLDPTDLLRVPGVASRVPKVLSIIDAMSSAAVAEVVERPAWRAGRRRVAIATILAGALGVAGRVVPRLIWRLWVASPEREAARAIAWMDERILNARQQVAAGSTALARLQRSLALMARGFRDFMLPVIPSIIAGVAASAMLRRLVAAPMSDFEALERGLHGNVTTEMDLAIGDLADLARAAPAVSKLLRERDDADLQSLRQAEGGAAFAQAFEAFIERYGMRGGSEIDVTRPRWADEPRPILQVIRGNLTRESAGHHREHHQALRREGEAAAARIIAQAPWPRRLLVRRLVRAVRGLTALREHPKFQIVRQLQLVRSSALELAKELVARGILAEVTDVWLLYPSEVMEAAAASNAKSLRALVLERREQMAHHARLAPPRVMTSEGEMVTPKRDRGDAPPGALVGTGASAGVVEGTARVVLDPARAVLHAGEILIAPFTDPGWTPLFINAKGLVMEVGGMMTHGSVVAREYGIPAVVCVDHATTLIPDGSRVRVDGTRGFVELIAAAPAE